MSDKPTQSFGESIEQRKARVAEQEAALAREKAEIAELERVAPLFAKYNFIVTPAPPKDGGNIGTLAELADCYRTDSRSPYRKLRFRVRQSYDFSIKRITRDAGH